MALSGQVMWTHYLLAYGLLALVLVPLNILVGGRLYPDGQVDHLAAIIVVALVLLILVALFRAKPLYGFYLAAAIATTNCFSLLPTWVYRVEGVARLDDLVLLCTTLVALMQRIPPVRRAPRRAAMPVLFLLAIVGFELLYTTLVVGERPWLVLREARPYAHYLWYFLSFAFLTSAQDIALFLKLVLLGTLGNALSYSAQVLFQIDLGYVDAGYFPSSTGDTIWRIWQGIPDLLLIGIVVFAWLGMRRRAQGITSWMAAMALTLCLFLTNTRSLMAVYTMGTLLALVLYSRSFGAGLVRTAKRTVLLAAVLAVGIMSASRLLNVQNVIVARLDLSRAGTEVVTADANLGARLLLLSDVLARVSAGNRWLGLGFVSANSRAAEEAGIEYFGALQVRNNDIGLATLLGQGGFVLLTALALVLGYICVRLYRMSRRLGHDDFALATGALVAFIVCQVPLSVTTLGLTSSQVIATISVGVATLELWAHLARGSATPRNLANTPVDPLNITHIDT